MYKFSNTGVEAKIRVKIKFQKVVDIEVEILLPLVKIFEIFLVNLSLPEGRLLQVRNLTIFLKVNYKTFFFLLNRLTNLLGLELLKL